MTKPSVQASLEASEGPLTQLLSTAARKVFFKVTTFIQAF